MKRIRALVVLGCFAGCGSQSAPGSTAVTIGKSDHHAQHGPAFSLKELAEGAVLLGDLGTHTRKVSTDKPEAQAFFDQGLALTFGFNHDEAARSFARAAAIDPSCAICYWGAAYTLGPNYNMPLLPDRAAAAWDAITRAQKQLRQASPVEAALITALSKRYPGPNYVDPVAMQPRNVAYAEAMREVATTFPDDDDVQALFAEALMNVNPWKLWSADGKPAPLTLDAVAALETVLKRAPNHPGANHYYIHAVEASPDPGVAIAAADRLGKLVPGAGHLVHMPAHIYQRVGRYADASLANERAIEADANYLKRVKPPGYYPFYLGHNYGFLAYSRSMQGAGVPALLASMQSRDSIPRDIVCGMPGMDFFIAEPMLVMVRFGMWQEILAEKQPDPKYQVLTALWHHARGMALAAQKRPDEALQAAAAIRELADKMPADMLAGLNEGKKILELAARVVEARVADQRTPIEALKLWEEAVALEDSLAYNEPADWFYPVRHYHGAALLDASKARDAERVFRADLAKNPQNGWALYGIWRSLVAQKKNKQAKVAEKEFRAAWAGADIELTRAAF